MKCTTGDRKYRYCAAILRSLAIVIVTISLVLLSSVADAADIQVTNTDDSGDGSLRRAIENAVAGDRIVFAIPGGGTITLLSDLPTISDNVSFTNNQVAGVSIDLNGNSPIIVTGGVVDLGELSITGATPAITFSPATTLIGDGEQITADVQTSGSIAPGSTNTAGVVGELIIDGELNASNSTLRMDLYGNGVQSNDLIKVDGTIDITDATLQPNFVGSDFQVENSFTIIGATSVNGEFANDTDIFQLPENPFLEAAINTVATEVTLEIQDNGVDFAAVVRGCNPLAAATELDRLRLGAASPEQEAAIISRRNGWLAEVNTAVNQFASTIYPTIADAEIHQIQNQIHAIRDRVLLQHDAAINLGRWAPWVRGYGSTLSADADQCHTLGYRQESAGVELGTGIMHASGWGLHGFSQLGAANTWLRGGDQSADTDSYRFGGSVQYLGEWAYLQMVGGFGFHDHSVTRALDAFSPGGVARSEFDGRDQFGSVEVGTATVGNNSLWLSFISLQGIRVDLDGVRETGGSDFSLSQQGIDETSLRSLLGFSFVKSGATELGPASTQVRLGWLHEFRDTWRTVEAAVTSAEPAEYFTVRSSDTDRDWLSIGAQLDWAFMMGGQFTIAYQGNVNSNSAFQSGLVGARWIF